MTHPTILDVFAALFGLALWALPFVILAIVLEAWWTSISPQEREMWRKVRRNSPPVEDHDEA